MPVLEHETLVEVGTVDSKPQDEQMIQAAGNKNHVYLVAVLGVAMICLLVVLVGAELSNDPELHVQRVRETQATELWWGQPTPPPASFDLATSPAATAANEEYLRPYLAGLAIARKSSLGKDIIDLADLVDLVPTSIDNLVVEHLLPGSQFTVSINELVPLHIKKWGWLDIPLPASFEIVSVTFNDLNMFEDLADVHLLEGGNFTWSMKMAIERTTVFVVARVNLLGHDIFCNVSLTLHEPAVQMAAIVALNQSKICQVWGSVMKSSSYCAAWPIMNRPFDQVAGLNITVMQVQVTDFDANLTVAGAPFGLSDTISTRLLAAINDEKSELLAKIMSTNISHFLPRKMTAEFMAEVPSLQARCSSASKFTEWKPPCICDSSHPFCYQKAGSTDDGYCYESEHSFAYSTTTCVGSCTESFDDTAGWTQLLKAKARIENVNSTMNVDRICVSNNALITLEWSYQDCFACQPGTGVTLPAESDLSAAQEKGAFTCMNIEHLDETGCSCSVKHPHCNSEDQYCYKSSESNFFNSGFNYLTRSTCPGSCTRDYDPHAPMPFLKDGDAMRVKTHADAYLGSGYKKLLEPAMRYVNESNTAGFECSGTSNSDYNCALVSVVPTNPDVWPTVSSVCVINHAGFDLKFQVENGRTGGTAETLTFPANQKGCLDLSYMSGNQVGDEFLVQATSDAGNMAYTAGFQSQQFLSNEPITFAENGLTAAYECQLTGALVPQESECHGCYSCKLLR